MDDANIPSLLSLSLIGFLNQNDTIYQNTRKLVLSNDNPYFFSGPRGSGIGGPHVMHCKCTKHRFCINDFCTLGWVGIRMANVSNCESKLVYAIVTCRYNDAFFVDSHIDRRQ